MTSSETWARGRDLKLPKYSTIRTAARLLRAESYLLAVDGRYTEAIAHQRLGFRVAVHGASDPMLLAHLVAVACEAITLAGLEDILYLLGPNEKVAEQLRASIVLYAPRLSLRGALEGEVVMAVATMDLCRGMGPRAILAFSGGESTGTAAKEMTALWEKSPRIQQWWKDLTDAGEADLLLKLRRAIAMTERPVAERRRVAQELVREVESRQMGVIGVFSAVMIPSLDHVVVRGAGACIGARPRGRGRRCSPIGTGTVAGRNVCPRPSAGARGPLRQPATEVPS